MDYLEKWGVMALGSRLKRLSELLLRDISQVYRDLGIDFDARWFATLYALSRQDELSITSIANRLNLSHPAIISITRELESQRYIESIKDPRDQRRRLLRLTPSGKELVNQLGPVWEDIELANWQLLRETAPEFLENISSIETALKSHSMHDRVIALQRQRQYHAIEIIPFQPEYAVCFRDLNLEWLTKDFEVEEEDWKVLNDPVGEIIQPGGAVLFARVDQKVVGTVALIKQSNTKFELAKMAVANDYRRQQIGLKLAVSAISYVHSQGGNKIVLMTSPILARAVFLYRKLGFKTLPTRQTRYRRETIVMELNLHELSSQISQLTGIPVFPSKKTYFPS